MTDGAVRAFQQAKGRALVLLTGIIAATFVAVGPASPAGAIEPKNGGRYYAGQSYTGPCSEYSFNHPPTKIWPQPGETYKYERINSVLEFYVSPWNRWHPESVSGTWSGCRPMTTDLRRGRFRIVEERRWKAGEAHNCGYDARGWYCWWKHTGSTGAERRVVSEFTIWDECTALVVAVSGVVRRNDDGKTKVLAGDTIFPGEVIGVGYPGSLKLRTAKIRGRSYTFEFGAGTAWSTYTRDGLCGREEHFNLGLTIVSGWTQFLKGTTSIDPVAQDKVEIETPEVTVEGAPAAPRRGKPAAPRRLKGGSGARSLAGPALRVDRRKAQRLTVVVAHHGTYKLKWRGKTRLLRRGQRASVTKSRIRVAPLRPGR